MFKNKVSIKSKNERKSFESDHDIVKLQAVS